MVKRLPPMRETRVQSLGWEDPLETEMATHSSVLAWRIPWTEEPGRLQSTGLQRVGHDWATSLSLSFTFFPASWSAFTIQWTPEYVNSSLVESVRKAQQTQREQLCSTDGRIPDFFFMVTLSAPYTYWRYHEDHIIPSLIFWINTIIFFSPSIILASANIVVRLNKNNQKGFFKDVGKCATSKKGLDLDIKRKFPVQGKEKHWVIHLTNMIEQLATQSQVPFCKMRIHLWTKQTKFLQENREWAKK